MMQIGKKRWIAIGAAALGAALVIGACAGSKPTATVSGGQPQAANPAPVLPAGQGARLLASESPLGANQQVGVWVNGAGSASARPDVGVLSFGVEARADTVAAARDQAATAMDAVLRALRGNGVQERDIQTQQFSIQPVFAPPSPRGNDQPPLIIGYRVNNNATAKVRDLDKFGAAIDAAARAGGNAIRIQGIRLTIDNPKPLEEQARSLAIRDATAKAQQIARESGITLGAPVFVSESSATPLPQARALGVAALEGAPTPISPGETQVTIHVQMVFTIRS